MEADEGERGGFAFDLLRRNTALAAMGMKAPTATKTGTTICGVIYKDGVVLGADTRSTNGDTVADKCAPQPPVHAPC
jgi:20S proteasome subunit beta 2